MFFPATLLSHLALATLKVSSGGSSSAPACSTYKSEAGCTSQPGLRKCIWINGKCIDAPPSPTPPGPSPPGPTPPASGPSVVEGGLYMAFDRRTYAVTVLNKSSTPSTWDKTNNFSFVAPLRSSPGSRQGCHALGDLTIRAKPSSSSSLSSSGWSIFSSAEATTTAVAVPVTEGLPPSTLPGLAHDISALLNNTATGTVSNGSNPHWGGTSPFRVVRSYESGGGTTNGQGGIVIRWNITNAHASDSIVLGGLGFSMPNAGQQNGIEESVWNDPHIGGDHAYVEWVRVVVDQQTLLATSAPGSSESGSGMEAWRPVLENNCARDTWEWTVHSAAWATEWKENKQWPYVVMEPALAAETCGKRCAKGHENDPLWKQPHASPWPSWHGHETVPLTDFEGFSAPWNAPTESTAFAPGETRSYALRLSLAPLGPRTTDAALTSAGKASIKATPGFVVAPDMKSAMMHVTPPNGATLTHVAVSDASVLTAAITTPTTIAVAAHARGRCRVAVTFSDESVAYVHYLVVPPFATQVARVGDHWANDAWLPRDFVDPFGRSASVMPYDRVDRVHVLDDSRAYDVGLSDDAGGGNPLGFAIKNAYAPTAHGVNRLDDYVKWTLYGVKPDTAQHPLKSLQIRPEDVASGAALPEDLDGIRMTMYYYNNAGDPSSDCVNTTTGALATGCHFKYNYTESNKCGINNGGQGGPNWCMSEGISNATYRAFNFPHHVTTYLALYLAARNTLLPTYQTWEWYLTRAAKTAIKFGRPQTGVMDGTVFREILRSIEEEATLDPKKWATYAATITANMNNRTVTTFAAQEYPYGSEFSFDTTGQEEVVVWLLHFANSSNTYAAAAKRTVDHVLSYMRASATWAYNGGARSWGDLGNNGKWFTTAGTSFENRGNMHYRSGLNAIPLLAWYKQHPDDFFLLEVALGAVAGQMANIDEHGAPSMMMHMAPHILEFDPHSGDFGLGFFGISLESASYFVQHPTRGSLCYLCNLEDGATKEKFTLAPVDAYRRRVYLEPLGVMLEIDAGTFASVEVDLVGKMLTVQFATPLNATLATWRLRVNKMATSRPGSKFVPMNAAFSKLTRGAFEIPVSAKNARVAVSYV